jgi:hypothetical protein
MAAPPPRKLRVDRIILALVLLGGIGFGVYYLVAMR